MAFQNQDLFAIFQALNGIPMPGYAFKNTDLKQIYNAIIGGGGGGEPLFEAFEAAMVLENAASDVVYNWDTGEFFDSSSVLSANMLDRTLNNSSGTGVYYWDLNLLVDSTSQRSIEVDFRQLKRSDGTAVSIDWENCFLGDSDTVTSIDWQARKLYTTGGGLNLDYSSGLKGYNSGSDQNFGISDFDAFIGETGSSTTTQWDFSAGVITHNAPNGFNFFGGGMGFAYPNSGGNQYFQIDPASKLYGVGDITNSDNGTNTQWDDTAQTITNNAPNGTIFNQAIHVPEIKEGSGSATVISCGDHYLIASDGVTTTADFSNLGAPISDATGGVVIDIEARASINDLLSQIRSVAPFISQ